MYNEQKGGIERQSVKGFALGDHRYGSGIRAIHQGRVERILEDDLRLYCEREVVREASCVDVRFDEEGDGEFPVLATLETEGVRRTVRTKYLVGADGGRSSVRRSLGIEMKGEMLDDVWGVVDLVADTDYPDVRRQGFVMPKDGFIVHIPREKKSNGDYITRLYVKFPPTPADEVENVVNMNGHTPGEHEEAKQRHYRATITLERILADADKCFKPHHMKQKAGTDVEWWTAYQVGQRVASRFEVKDSKQHPRVFLMGDACHTHSPKMGQGMNVSMMDAFDLSWKLAHTLFGLTSDGTRLLETYASERRDHALNLIDVDKRWYNSRYGKDRLLGGSRAFSEDGMLAEVRNFVAGVGIEYEAGSMLVDWRVTSDDPDAMVRYNTGALREGRRLEDAVVKRFADGNLVHLHDQMEINGRYSVVIWTGKDLLDKGGTCQTVLTTLVEELLPQLPPELVKVFIMSSLEYMSFEWTQLPTSVKAVAEMRLYHTNDDTYRKFGVDLERGGMCVVRPDMYIGTIAGLSAGPEGLEKVSAYLKRCLIQVA